MSKLKAVDGSVWAFMKKCVIPSRDGTEDYLVRWRLVQTPWFAFYLHKIMTPDMDEHLHDHPWNFTSIILSNGYLEETPEWGHLYTPGAWNHKKATDMHKIALFWKPEKPVWSLMIIGRRKRDWGFDVDGEWVDHATYLGLTEEDYK